MFAFGNCFVRLLLFNKLFRKFADILMMKLLIFVYEFRFRCISNVDASKIRCAVSKVLRTRWLNGFI